MNKTLRTTAIMLSSFIFSASGLLAQNRQSNLEVIMTSPSTDTFIGPEGTFDLAFIIKNNGPDDLLPTDTIIFSSNIDQSAYVGTVGLINNNTGLDNGATTSSFPLTTLQNTNNATDTAQIEICVTVYDINSSGFSENGAPVTVSYDDPDTSNNTACVTVSLAPPATGGGGTGIFDVKKGTEVLNLYPNPARNQVTFGVAPGSTGGIMLSVKDMLGREVMRRDLGKADHRTSLDLDISTLRAGLYFVEVNIGVKKAVGKLTVQH